MRLASDLICLNREIYGIYLLSHSSFFFSLFLSKENSKKHLRDLLGFVNLNIDSDLSKSINAFFLLLQLFFE